MFGLGDFNLPTSGVELTNAIVCTVNTNATNSFILMTANGGTRTFGYSQHASNIYTAMTFLEVGWRLDSTGTNTTMFIGTNPTNFVTVITNIANVPTTTMVGPIIAVTQQGGTTTSQRTNYIDSYHLWARPLHVRY